MHLATIARYYLMAILSIEHDLSQKLDLEAVATVAIVNQLKNQKELAI